MNKTLYCKTINELPDSKIIQSTPRGSQLKVVFRPTIQTEVNAIGQKWKIEYPDFLIRISDHKCIFLSKLITDTEIEDHQDFFVKCAQDYKQLATQLINEFAKNKKLIIHEEYPMKTLNPSETNGYKQDGEMNDWHYSFHGFHCAFTHQKSNQHIEVPLMFGLEFGVLDPFFFSEYIKSTKSYHPLPIPILNDFEDGNRILNKMITLGKFEKINSNWSKGLKGIALTDPHRTEIKVYVPKKTSPKSDDRTKIKISISEEIPPKTYATRFLNYIKKFIQ